MKYERTIYALILGFVGFVTSFGAHIVAVNLPFYAETVGVGVAVIGLLIAAYDFAEIIAKPLFGALADRQGMKRTMLAGIVVSNAILLVDYINTLRRRDVMPLREAVEVGGRRRLRRGSGAGRRLPRVDDMGSDCRRGPGSAIGRSAGPA